MKVWNFSISFAHKKSIICNVNSIYFKTLSIAIMKKWKIACNNKNIFHTRNMIIRKLKDKHGQFCWCRTYLHSWVPMGYCVVLWNIYLNIRKFSFMMRYERSCTLSKYVTTLWMQDCIVFLTLLLSKKIRNVTSQNSDSKAVLEWPYIIDINY